MDFVTTKELRAESGKVWEKLEAGEEIVITRNGKPFALMVHTEPNELESKLRSLRAEKFGRLVAEQQKRSVGSGLDKMTLEEINAEIAAARQGRRERAIAALESLREHAKATGLDQMTLEEINAEIAAARAERDARENASAAGR